MEKAITKHDITFQGWSEYDVKEKAWQLYMLDGATYVKRDFKGNFLNCCTGKLKTLGELFPDIRNCTDSEGFILAKRKRYGQALRPEKRKTKVPRN